MKSKSSKIPMLLFMLCALALSVTPAHGQTSGATVVIRQYDVIFLTDLLNMTTQKLKATISGFSVEIMNPPQVFSLQMTVQVQLRGDPKSQILIQGSSGRISSNNRNPFILTARNFASGGIAALNAEPDPTVKQRLINLAQTSTTVPPGIYTIAIIVTDAGTNRSYTGNETLVVPFSSVEEVFVEINDPRDGSIINNLFPTFSWTTAASSTTVRVFEAGPSARSPQDALNGGNPHLVQELTGVATLTYPANASRQLEMNKAYVLQVEANVATNRGTMGNFSRPVVFRITDDKIGKILDDFLNAYDGPVASTYSTLRSDPSDWVAWPAFGNMTFDGTTVLDDDLRPLLNSLTGRTDVDMTLTVENQ